MFTFFPSNLKRPFISDAERRSNINCLPSFKMSTIDVTNGREPAR